MRGRESKIPIRKRKKKEKVCKSENARRHEMRGVVAHKVAKGALGAKKEYVQPTHTVQTEDGVTSSPGEVHQAFAEEWSKKVFKLQRQKPDWEEFK